MLSFKDLVGMEGELHTKNPWQEVFLHLDAEEEKLLVREEAWRGAWETDARRSTRGAQSVCIQTFVRVNVYVYM